MSLVLSTLLAAALQTPPQTGWTWTLYENSGPLVLAEEVPDTPNLKATLECEPGSGAVTVAVYGSDAPAGFARIVSGEVEAAGEARRGRSGKLETMVRVDHPAFAAFVAGGELTIAAGGAEARVVVERPHLAKLRRFADRCAG